MSLESEGELHRLVYLSSARDLLTEAGLDAILEASRRNNSRVGVTGLLLYHEGSFLQVLEGPKAEVLRIYEIIGRDSRHRGLIMLESSASQERAFADWSMGYVAASHMSAMQKDGLIDLTSELARHGPYFTPSARVSVQISAFLSSFREFGEF